LQVILTIWPEPTQRYIKSLYAGKGNLVNFVKKHKKYVYGVELEDEDNWAEAFTGEGESLETAAGELISKLREKLPGIEIGVTSTSRGFRHSMLRKDSLLNHEDVHFISFQTYQPYHAVYQKHRCVKADNLDDYAPGQFQKKVINTIKLAGLAAKKSLILGLPAYDQDCPAYGDGPGMRGIVNMYKAAKVAICRGKVSVPRMTLIGDSYWSARNIRRGAGTPRMPSHFSLIVT
jgi:hypothetical protein